MRSRKQWKRRIRSQLRAMKRNGPKQVSKKYIDSLIKKQGVCNFYETRDWKSLRIRTFAKQGNKCQACGVSAKDKQLHVDHIQPISLFPEFALSPDNLQILCVDCNVGKSNHFSHDFRG